MIAKLLKLRLKIAGPLPASHLLGFGTAWNEWKCLFHCYYWRCWATVIVWGFGGVSFARLVRVVGPKLWVFTTRTRLSLSTPGTARLVAAKTKSWSGFRLPTETERLLPSYGHEVGGPVSLILIRSLNYSMVYAGLQFLVLPQLNVFTFKYLFAGSLETRGEGLKPKETSSRKAQCGSNNIASFFSVRLWGGNLLHDWCLCVRSNNWVLS